MYNLRTPAIWACLKSLEIWELIPEINPKKRNKFPNGTYQPFGNLGIYTAGDACERRFCFSVCCIIKIFCV